MSEEKLAFTRRIMTLGNFGLLLWVFLASASVIFYNQVYGWLYLIFLFVTVYAIQACAAVAAISVRIAPWLWGLAGIFLAEVLLRSRAWVTGLAVKAAYVLCCRFRLCFCAGRVFGCCCLHVGLSVGCVVTACQLGIIQSCQ